MSSEIGGGSNSPNHNYSDRSKDDLQEEISRALINQTADQLLKLEGDKDESKNAQKGHDSVDEKGVKAGLQMGHEVMNKAMDDSSLDPRSEEGSKSTNVSMAVASSQGAHDYTASLKSNSSQAFGKAVAITATRGASVLAASSGVELCSHAEQTELKTNESDNYTSPQGLSQTDQAKVQSLQNSFNQKSTLLKDANQSLWKAGVNYQNAVKEYGSDSKQAKAIAKQMVQIRACITQTNVVLAGDMLSTKAVLKEAGVNPSGNSVYEGMSSTQEKQNKVSAKMLKEAANLIGGAPPNSKIDLTNKNIFGNYNSRVLAGGFIAAALVAAMIKSSDVTNNVTQQQTAVEAKMQNTQKSLNNYLQKKLSGENGILDHLAELGKKEASASQVSTGLFATFGNMWNGTYFGCTLEPLMEMGTHGESAKEAFSGHNIGDNYKHAWEGIGETLGFVPPAANVEGEIVATNGRLTQLNSGCQIATQKVSNLTTAIQAQGRTGASSAQATQSLNQLMTSIVRAWAQSVNQAISSGGG